MAIYNKKDNLLIIAENELSIQNLMTADEVYQLGFDAGYEDGYGAGMEECYPDYSKKYFTIEMTSNGRYLSYAYPDFDYRINGGEWNHYMQTEINLSKGDIMEFRSITESVGWMFSTINEEIKLSGTFKAYGNIMSLFYGDDYEDKTEFPVGTTGNCINMFCTNTGLTDARNLVLPANTLTNSCYAAMFSGTSITVAPELPATDLADACYAVMFSCCENLTEAPILPATTLAPACYQNMFNSCTSLVIVPELPATTLAYNCYDKMFEKCTAITTAPELPAQTLAPYCYLGMFAGCTGLTASPSLAATKLEEGCYIVMFNGCTSLSSVVCLATDISANSCVNLWMGNVPPTGTFTKAQNMNSWSTGMSGIPAGWTVVDAEL